LGVNLLRQGCEDKLPAVVQIAAELSLKPKQVCYIGDDLPDLPVLRWVGWPVAVADAAEEIRSAAAMVTQLSGGRGAVRETVKRILQAKGLWEDLIRRYTGP
jgi:YrbI family 3-deoxy-D-manno-octulosonate 8-phosphate phosphatase